MAWGWPSCPCKIPNRGYRPDEKKKSVCGSGRGAQVTDQPCKWYDDGFKLRQHRKLRCKWQICRWWEFPVLFKFKCWQLMKIFLLKWESVYESCRDQVWFSLVMIYFYILLQEVLDIWMVFSFITLYFRVNSIVHIFLLSCYLIRIFPFQCTSWFFTFNCLGYNIENQL